MRLLPADVRLILVGDGENLAACKSFAESQGLSDRVQFVGNQSDVNAWIAKADVGIQSSKWGGFGLTAVELMAAGKPVVATDVEGLRQVVEGAGLLFPVGDEERLATMVKRLLDDESYYKQIAGKCSERAKLYDIHVTVDRYLEIYNEIIDR
jgi:glycosyltransferase involved in cell wall biosynthesis